MQDLLKYETEDSKTKPKKCVISFDLQQAMPIPNLTAGHAFYYRKVWLYNLGIHDRTRPYVFMDRRPKPGSDEVGFLLLKFLSNKREIEDFVIFTDNCPGENKNWLFCPSGYS